MIAALILLALAQPQPQPQPQPSTVGDTVWLEIRVPLQARQILRAQTWELGEVGQVLGPPLVELTPDSAVVRYPVTFWFPGRHPVAVPGPIVVNPEGRSDTLPARRLQVEVASVLPPDTNRDSTPPRPQAGVIPQAGRSLLPLGVLWIGLLGLAGLVAWRLARARRPRSPAPRAAPVPVDFPGLLDRWAEAGELKTAADGWAHLLARAAGVPADTESARVLGELDRIGFRPDPPAEDVDAAIAAAKRILEAGR